MRKLQKITLISLIIFSILFLLYLVISSFVSFADPISSSDMQNYYIKKILIYGLPSILIQVLAIYFCMKKCPTIKKEKKLEDV